MGDDPLAVVGAGAAGLTVVNALRRQGYTERIVLIGEEPHPPYDRPPLSKGFLLGNLDRSRIALRDSAALQALDLDLRLGRCGTGLDLRERVLRLDDGSDVAFSRLVVATGVRSARPPGLADTEVHTLRTIDDAERIAAAMESAATVAVIGGGPLGYELAAAARGAGREVTLIDRASVPLGRVLGTLVGELVGELHREHGVELRTGRSVQSVTRHAGDRNGAAGSARITLDDGSSLDADLVIAAVGSEPNVEWLRGSGLDLSDGVGCDPVGRAAPGVYAIGDVARWGATDGAGVRVEHRTNATEQAVAVAQHILHGTQAPAAIRYFWTDQFGDRIQVAGQIPDGAQIDVTAGDLSSRRFVLTATQGGVLTGVVAWRMAKAFTRHRARLAGVT